MTASTYGEHITLAARYASLTLITPPCPRADLSTMLVLRDDVVVNLAALVRDLAGLTGIDRRPRSVAVLARDPVGALAARLTTLPRLGADDRPPPSHRYAHRPARPTEVATPLDAWTGLAVETLLARDCIDRSATPLSDTARWTALGDVAVLAQALDPLDQTLLPAPDNPRSLDLWRVVRDADGALAMEAREVTALARGLRDDAAAAVVPAGARSVVLVSSIDAIPPAITALTDLVAATGPDVGAPGALAAATALAKTSLLTARVLHTAAREPRVALPELLAGTADALDRHGSALQPEIVRLATRLASLPPSGGAAVRHQASELGGEGARRLQDLLHRPAAALAATPALLEVAARLPAATTALAGALDLAHEAGRLLVRDPGDRPRTHWTLSTSVHAVAPLSPQLHDAAATAAAAPLAPRRWTPPAPTPPAGAITDLAVTLQRRHAASRPCRPGLHRTQAPVLGL